MLGPPLKAEKTTTLQSSDSSSLLVRTSEDRQYSGQLKLKYWSINDKNYCILGEIGRGASARIYNAYCIQSMRLVAIKSFSLSEDSLNLCEHEYRILENLIGKSHVIQLVDASVSKGMLVLERGECTLAALLTQDKIGDLSFISYFFPQAVKGVALLHQSNAIHCDVKPSNFVLCYGAILKIIDFGIAKWIVNEDDIVFVDKDNQMGTLSYMAPESLKVVPTFDAHSSFVQMGTPADVWALGCILHEMLMGFLPFSKKSLKIKEKAALIISPDHQVDIPTKDSRLWNFWRSIALRCLVKDPSKRIKISELLSHISENLAE